MKILWLSHQLPYPPKGGAYQRSYNMLVQVGKENSVDFVTLAAQSSLVDSFGSVNVGLDKAKSALNKFVNVVSISVIGNASRSINRKLNAIRSIFSLSTYDEVYYRHPEFAKAINSKLELEQYDVIYVDTVSLMPLVCTSKIPIILNHHNIESMMLARRSEQETNPIKKMVYLWETLKMKWAEQKYISIVGVNITCSELDEDRLKTIKACSTQSIPNGVDTDYFSRSKPYSSATTDGLIFIGGLSWYPNADAMEYFAKSIYPCIKENIGDVKTDIIGRGSVTSLNELASREPSVTAHGFVDDILPIMEQAQAYICPIRDGGGTKLKVLDALAMGVPLIAHPIACEGIEVESGKNVLFASTPEEYCKQIERLKGNSQLGGNLSEQGIALINRKYSYSIIGKHLNELIENVGTHSK